MRIDAHRHYWRYDPKRDGWITDEMSILRRDFLPTSAPTPFDGVIAVQADQSLAETAFLLALAAEHSFIRGVVGWVDLCAPDLDEQLAQWQDGSALKGFRHVAQAEPDDFLVRPEVVRGITTLGEHGYSYDILIYPRQLEAAEALAKRCPSVTFVLDHCAKPAIAKGEISEWRVGIERLAQHPNLYCKISGLVTEANWGGWSDTDLLPYLDAAADAFGIDRLIFGSDWPVCLLAAPYDDVLGVVDRWAERWTSTERGLLFGGTATAVYRLEGRDGS